jgi:hypothetical protein
MELVAQTIAMPPIQQRFPRALTDNRKSFGFEVDFTIKRIELL